jgi:hypothetical protein
MTISIRHYDGAPSRNHVVSGILVRVKDSAGPDDPQTRFVNYLGDALAGRQGNARDTGGFSKCQTDCLNEADLIGFGATEDTRAGFMRKHRDLITGQSQPTDDDNQDYVETVAGEGGEAETAVNRKGDTEMINNGRTTDTTRYSSFAPPTRAEAKAAEKAARDHSIARNESSAAKIQQMQAANERLWAPSK